jgi:hypothetical protein
MVARFHGQLNVTAFNTNDILSQSCELSKQLQDLHMDVALHSETHLKPHEVFLLFFNYHFYRTERISGRKGGTAVAVRKGIPHNITGLIPLVSIKVTALCITTGNSEVLFAVVYKSPGHA